MANEQGPNRESKGESNEITEAEWVRRKLDVPADSPSHVVYGRLHVWEARQRSSQVYIASGWLDALARVCREVVRAKSDVAQLGPLAFRKAVELAEVALKEPPQRTAETTEAIPKMVAALVAFIRWYAVDSTEIARDSAFEDARDALVEAFGRCPSCDGRGWFIGECHPREVCASCDGVGAPVPVGFVKKEPRRG